MYWKCWARCCIILHIPNSSAPYISTTHTHAEYQFRKGIERKIKKFILPQIGINYVSFDDIDIFLFWLFLKNIHHAAQTRISKKYLYHQLIHILSHGGLGSIWIWTGSTPCTGLSDARQVLPSPYPMSAGFQLWWGGQIFYSTWPFIGIFYPPH